jgi:hypothetical protein
MRNSVRLPTKLSANATKPTFVNSVPLVILAAVALAACRRSTPPAATDQSGARDAAPALRVPNTLRACPGRSPALLSPSLADWTPVAVIQNPDSSYPVPSPDRIEFRNGYCLDPDVYDVEVVGLLPAGTIPPFLVLLARHCVECDEGDTKSLIVGSPLHGSFQRGVEVLSPPGRLRRWEDDSVASESTVFIGRCLSDSAEVLIAFDRFREDSTWKHDVHLIYVVGDTLRNDSLASDVYSVGQMQDSSRSPRCRQLPGSDQRDTRG